MEHAGEYYNHLDSYKQQAKQILKQLNPRSASKCTVESNEFSFHYLLSDGVCYLTLTDKCYPKRLAFLYLEEIHQGFHAELGDSFQVQIDTVARPYAFITFDKFIQRKRKDYIDPSSRENMSKVNDNLSDIHNIMRQNIQEVLSRGERLENVSKMSSNLADRSKEFKWGAKKLHLQAIYRKYGPLVAVGVFILLIFYFKFM